MIQIQTSNRGRLNDPNSNSRVMDYLKKVVPKMFQVG